MSDEKSKILSKGLGFIQLPDEKDKEYPLRLYGKPQRFRKSKFYKVGKVLDQKETSSCVGHAWAHFAMSAPKMYESANPYEIYALAQELDEFEGEEPEFQGSSVRGGAKAMKYLGYIDGSYSWSNNVWEIWDHLLIRGPIVVGTNWYSKMEDLSSRNYATPKGSLLGGHCYLLIGASVEKKSFLALNSWGEAWGEKGRFWISVKNMEKLLKEGGVACSALEV